MQQCSLEGHAWIGGIAPSGGWEWEVAVYKYMLLNTTSSLFRETDWYKLEWAERGSLTHSFWKRSHAGSRWQHLHLMGAPVSALASGIYHPGLMQYKQWMIPDGERGLYASRDLLLPGKCVTTAWSSASSLSKCMLIICWSDTPWKSSTSRYHCSSS